MLHIHKHTHTPHTPFHTDKTVGPRNPNVFDSGRAFTVWGGTCFGENKKNETKKLPKNHHTTNNIACVSSLQHHHLSHRPPRSQIITSGSPMWLVFVRYLFDFLVGKELGKADSGLYCKKTLHGVTFKPQFEKCLRAVCTSGVAMARVWSRDSWRVSTSHDLIFIQIK